MQPTNGKSLPYLGSQAQRTKLFELLDKAAWLGEGIEGAAAVEQAREQAGNEAIEKVSRRANPETIGQSIPCGNDTPNPPEV